MQHNVDGLTDFQVLVTTGAAVQMYTYSSCCSASLCGSCTWRPKNPKFSRQNKYPILKVKYIKKLFLM